MSSDLAKDRFVSHSVINYLNAAYQGKFASINMLSQLGHPAFSEAEMQKLQNNLGRITTWSKQLSEDECLLSASWTTAETFDAQNALDLLVELKPEFVVLANNIERILALKDIPSDQDIKHLISTFCRYCYSRDTYVRGFVEYGKNFNLPEVVKKYELVLESSKEDLQLNNQFITLYNQGDQKIGNMDSTFLATLHRSCIKLPGAFRSHHHDVNQLLSPFKGGLSFATADFTPSEGAKWESAGIGPVPAGYWRAYGISAEAAKEWISIQLADAVFAFEWTCFGFSAETAAPWFQNDFPPGYAMLWLQAGYDAITARELVEQGVREPPTVDEPKK